MPDLQLPRPTSSPEAGPLDDRFWDAVESWYRRRLVRDPIAATYHGVHDGDARLPDGSIDGVQQEIAEARALESEIEAIDPAGLAESVRLERDLALHSLRRERFDLEVHRVWARRSTAADQIGDAMFSVFARDYAPLPERLAALTARLEGVPRLLEEHKTRAVAPQVRLWQQLEMQSAGDLPGLFGEISAAGHGSLDEGAQRRLDDAVQTAESAIADYRTWIEAGLGRTADDWALGRETYDELVRLRSFDGLDTDQILEIGVSQLAENKAARVADARRIDPDADEPAVVDRVKSNHPETFEQALGAYRESMARARAYLVDHEIVTLPPGERISVIAMPEYLRKILPFAAYFEPPKFDPHPSGIYAVTPSVGNDPNAMREHYYASISNTSIHEAYPGHHLQLTAALAHPSLVRLMTEAPEFVEGWGMYSEQMMREQGFEDGPEFLLSMHTDAIWRACRIILDIRMHRGEMSVEEATDFLVANTAFERANARAEVFRYTYTPTYQMSYLLGKVLLLQLRADEERRLGDAFRLKQFHDTLMANGSMPISFHRRVLSSAEARTAPPL